MLLGGCAVLGASAYPLRPLQTAPVFSRMLLLRHAEKSDDDPQDPSLSEAGRERAHSLDRLLGAVRAAKLYATSYKRTRETLGPLAERLGAEPELYDVRDLEGLIQRLATVDPALLVIVAGHSNTTPALAKALGVELEELDERGYFPDASYDRLVFLTTSRTGADARARAVTALELRY
jgi:phosphohistidine phosphatase SixA